jgi:hypothetical protein
MSHPTQRRELTFKHNILNGRHGWLRLTPAYGVKVVENLIEDASNDDIIVDPFSGTGTTGLVAAERGYDCDLYELNPFLVWFAEAKTRAYTSLDIEAALDFADGLKSEDFVQPLEESWTPPMHNIDRWWSTRRLNVLAEVYKRMKNYESERSNEAIDLLRIAFCQTLIRWSNAAFNHQSMSFKQEKEQTLIEDEEKVVIDSFKQSCKRICEDAESPVSGRVRVFAHDSRQMDRAAGRDYTLLITSPPYPNRMSYIRELRPYMYWLGYLDNGRDSGEMDWKSIGGTWGIATSRLADWRPKGYLRKHDEILKTVKLISARSPLLANYIHKYFEDMYEHFRGLPSVLRDGATVNYVIGNSKFYDTIVPTESFYEAMMREHGIKHTETKVLRKRSSKKELLEYLVSGTFKK